MKNLKIKLGLFSLLAVFVASVFLTSCEQEQIVDLTPQQQVEHQNQDIMIMPFGIATDTKEIRDEYMKNATPELMDKMAENGKVAYYLISIDKLDAAAEQMSYGDFFCDLDLAALLTETELAALQNYEVNSNNQVDLRCSSWTFCHSYWARIGCCWSLCSVYTRDCGWKFWASEEYTECS